MTAIYDAHAHLGTEEERRIRKEQGIVTLYSISGVEEWEAARKMDMEGNMMFSVGIHPWDGEKAVLSDMLSYLDMAQALGEIGMDSLWCSLPLDFQERLFCRQLETAAQRKLPVILHTKDEEKTIGRIIREYPNRYMVHWYSSEKGEGLSDFISAGCFFTVGPDCGKNPAVRRIIREIPLEKLLVETDGWAAVCWALGERPAHEIRGVLENSISLISAEKGVSREAVTKQMEENFMKFIYG